MKVTRILLLFGGVMLVGGCPTPTTPGPEVVLSGDWETTVDETVVTFEFNDNGILVKITGERADGGTAELDVTGSTSTVDGSDVTVQWASGTATVTYEATLSEDENTLDGTVTSEIEFGDALVVTIPPGDLTLTRVGTDGGDDNGGGDTTGDATNGQQLYTNNCAVCHGADASGVVGPNIQNATAAEITEAMESATHAAFDFTEQEILDIAAYLETF